MALECLVLMIILFLGLLVTDMNRFTLLKIHKCLIISIFIILAGVFPQKKVFADCSIGAFNYGDPSNVYLDNRTDCPTIKINDPSATVIRNWGVSDAVDIATKMQDIPSGKYLMPQNEPNLESGQTPVEVANNIKLWVDEAVAQGKNITIVIPPYAHNQGSINGAVLNGQGDVLRELYNSGYLSKGINFVMGVNAYGSYDQVTQMLDAQRNLARSYGVGDILVSEVAIATHQDVVDGKISVADWMHQTAQLVFKLQNDPNSQYKGTMMFTSLLIGAQVPLFIDPVTGDYVFGCGDNLYTGNINSGASSYSGNITDLGCGAPVGIWGPLEGVVIDSSTLCTAPEEFSGALNCLHCSTHEELANDGNALSRLINGVISFFLPKGFDFDMALRGFENPVPKLRETNQDLFAPDGSTYLAVMYGGAGEDCDFESDTYKYEDPIKDKDYLPSNIPIPNKLFNPELYKKYNLGDAKKCISEQKRTTVARFIPDYAVEEVKTVTRDILAEGDLEYLGISLIPPTGTCNGVCYKPSEISVSFTADTANINSFKGFIPADVGTSENRFGAVGYGSTVGDKVGEMVMTGAYSPADGESGSYYVTAGDQSVSWVISGLGNIPADQKLNNIGDNGKPLTGSTHMEYNIAWTECTGQSCFTPDFKLVPKQFQVRSSAEIVAQVEQIPFTSELYGYVVDNMWSTPERQINGNTVLGIPAGELYSSTILKKRDLAFKKAKEDFLVNNYSYQDIINLRKAQRGVYPQTINLDSKKSNSSNSTLENKPAGNFVDKIASFDQGQCDGAKDAAKEPACARESYLQDTVRVQRIKDGKCTTRSDGTVDCDTKTSEITFEADVIIGGLNGKDNANPSGVTEHREDTYKDIIEGVPPLGTAGITANAAVFSLFFQPPEKVTPKNVALKDNPNDLGVDMGFDDEQNQLGFSNRPNDSTVISDIAYPGGAQGVCSTTMLNIISGNPEEQFVDDPSKVPNGELTRNTKRFLDSYDCFGKEYDDLYSL